MYVIIRAHYYSVCEHVSSPVESSCVHVNIMNGWGITKYEYFNTVLQKAYLHFVYFLFTFTTYILTHICTFYSKFKSLVSMHLYIIICLGGFFCCFFFALLCKLSSRLSLTLLVHVEVTITLVNVLHVKQDVNVRLTKQTVNRLDREKAS